MAYIPADEQQCSVNKGFFFDRHRWPRITVVVVVDPKRFASCSIDPSRGSRYRSAPPGRGRPKLALGRMHLDRDLAVRSESARHLRLRLLHRVSRARDAGNAYIGTGVPERGFSSSWPHTQLYPATISAALCQFLTTHLHELFYFIPHCLHQPLHQHRLF